jgi:hypothetical protein
MMVGNCDAPANSQKDAPEDAPQAASSANDSKTPPPQAILDPSPASGSPENPPGNSQWDDLVAPELLAAAAVGFARLIAMSIGDVSERVEPGKPGERVAKPDETADTGATSPDTAEAS